MNPSSFLAALFVCVLSLPAFADGTELKDPFEGMAEPKRQLVGAQLTVQQVEQIRALRRPGRPAERALEKELEATWAELEEKLLADGPVDAAAVTSLAEKSSRLMAQLDRLKVQNLIRIRELLTRDQVEHVRQAHRDLKELEAKRRAIPPALASDAP